MLTIDGKKVHPKHIVMLPNLSRCLHYLHELVYSVINIYCAFTGKNNRNTDQILMNRAAVFFP